MRSMVAVGMPPVEERGRRWPAPPLLPTHAISGRYMRFVRAQALYIYKGFARANHVFKMNLLAQTTFKMQYNLYISSWFVTKPN